MSSGARCLRLRPGSLMGADTGPSSAKRHSTQPVSCPCWGLLTSCMLARGGRGELPTQGTLGCDWGPAQSMWLSALSRPAWGPFLAGQSLTWAQHPCCGPPDLSQLWGGGGVCPTGSLNPRPGAQGLGASACGLRGSWEQGLVTWAGLGSAGLRPGSKGEESQAGGSPSVPLPPALRSHPPCSL